MRLDDLHPNIGSHRRKRRVGRGHGSGRGKTAGRGTKGQQARSGGGWNPRFEGGQTPIHLRLPHRRGFKNPFRVEYATVKLMDLDRFEAGAMILLSDLVAAGLVRRDEERPLKLLANGEITKAIHLEEMKYTKAAFAKLTGAGGSIRGASAPEPDSDSGDTGDQD
jgi:large subunit ribosomal protein L15